MSGYRFPISLNASRAARSAREPGWGPPLAPIPSVKVSAYVRLVYIRLCICTLESYVFGYTGVFPPALSQRTVFVSLCCRFYGKRGLGHRLPSGDDGGLEMGPIEVDKLTISYWSLVHLTI